jgi:hypothetical protein
MLCCAETETQIAAAETAAGRAAVRRRRLGRVQFKGKNEGIAVYELLGRAEENQTMPALDGFSAAVALFESGDLAGAAAAFGAIADQEPAARIYIEQIDELERASVRPDNPMIILHEK